MPYGYSVLEHRLDAYFATLRSSSLKDVLKRRAGSWQRYAAVTGSAIAMATGASAADIYAAGDIGAEPSASATPISQYLANSRNIPLVNAVKAAIAQQASPATTPVQVQAPMISANGVVPLYSKAGTIQPGEWVSIYGVNLASQTTMWNNDFPQTLGGTSVTINGKAAYLLFVSPGQINLQAPDDTARGTVPVIVTTAGGTALATVSLESFSPSFSMVDAKHVSGIILRSDGSGAYGGGTFDILGPTGKSLGYQTVAAKANDNVVLFGFGLGPTSPPVPSGQAYSGAAQVTNSLTLFINNVVVKTTFAGLSSAGLYQINLKLPYGLGAGDVPLQAMIGGVQTQPGVVISLDDRADSGSGSTVTTFPPVGSSPPPYFGSSFSGGGTFGGGTSGGGGGSSDAKKRGFEPRKLHFPPKK